MGTHRPWEKLRCSLMDCMWNMTWSRSYCWWRTSAVPPTWGHSLWSNLAYFSIYGCWVYLLAQWQKALVRLPALTIYLLEMADGQKAFGWHTVCLDPDTFTWYLEICWMYNLGLGILATTCQDWHNDNSLRPHCKRRILETSGCWSLMSCVVLLLSKSTLVQSMYQKSMLRRKD